MSLNTTTPLILSTAGKKAATQKSHPTHAVYHRHIIMHPRDTHLPYLSDAPYCKTRTLNATTSITFADLTEQQAADMQTRLQKVNGTIKQSNTYKLYLPPAEPETQVDVTVDSVDAAAKKSPYATAPSTCSKIKISSDFILFFPDAMVDASKFPNVNLSFGTNYSGWPTYCTPHGNYTLATFEQVLGDPSMPVVNIPVFTCGEMVSDEVSIEALLDILDYQKANPTKKVAMYYAVNSVLGDASYSAVVAELINAGILVGFAAGNQGMNICNTDFPPQCVPGSLQAGATQSPGNQATWWSNWSDVVPGNQYGDCVQVYLPGDFTSKKFKTELKGTSFSIPQALGWAIRWWNKNPTATTADVISAYTNHAVVITKPASTKPASPPYTPTGQMRVVKTTDYCDINVTSSHKP